MLLEENKSTILKKKKKQGQSNEREDKARVTKKYI